MKRSVEASNLGQLRKFSCANRMTDNAGRLCSGAKAAAPSSFTKHHAVDDAMTSKSRPTMHYSIADREQLGLAAICKKPSDACDRVSRGFEIRQFGNQLPVDSTSPESSTFGMDGSIR
jgi:hypothetical protein